MKLVIIESPFAGDVARNQAYAMRCLMDSLQREEAPLASHLLYTQVLDDKVPAQRRLGISAGIAWYRAAEACVVYTDHGVTEGMADGIDAAVDRGIPVIYREIGK